MLDLAKFLPGKELPAGYDIADWIAENPGQSPKWYRMELDRLKTCPQDIQKSIPWLQSMSSVQLRELQWLWPGYIAQGKFTLLAGDPGVGKSFLSLDIAARVSRGDTWPGGGAAPIGDVVLVSSEDDKNDTILPRLMSAGANLERVHIFPEFNDIIQDLHRLEEMFQIMRQCRLMIIDPISAYLGEADSHRNAEVRAILTPLCDLLAEKKVALLAITHLRKSEGQAVYRTLGSVALCRPGPQRLCRHPR